MAEPLCIIGTAGAIANIIDVLTKTITTICDMRQAWKIADLTVLAFENQLNLLKIALCQIQKWAASQSEEQGHELVMQVDSCVTCCRLLISKIDSEVSLLERTTIGDLNLPSKLGLLFKTKDMEQIQWMIDQQTHALALLLSVCTTNAIEDQKKILHQPRVIRAFQKMDRDTASLTVHRDADSIVTATSVSSSKWSVQFAFDSELFITRVYKRWIRKLATTPKVHMSQQSNSTQQTLLDNSDDSLSVTNVPGETEQSIFTRSNSTASEESSGSSLSLGKRFNSLTRSAMGIELQPLKRNGAISDLKHQSKDSQKIDWNLKDDSKGASPDVEIVILGSNTRKRVVEEMKRANGHQCYTAEQLCLFRPIIFGSLIKSARYLARTLQHSRFIDELNPIRHQLEHILTYGEGSKHGTTLSPEFAVAIAQVKEHPATKALMEAEDFYPPENGEYFLDEINRISAETYVPSDRDAMECRISLPGCMESTFTMGRLNIRLIDPGSAISNSKVLFPQPEKMHVVMFVFDLSAYHQVLQSGETGLYETMLQFEAAVNSRRLKNSSIIVILNNMDTFRKKLLTVPLNQYFPDYTEGNDASEASNYILSRINQLNRANLNLYPHLTAGVFHETSLRSIRANIQDVIMANALIDLQY
ncbi:hypothetical protein BFJ70_g17482 [Fusarium oxysporum]|uniref:Guanine nucleotide-binding protein alpha-3 subunit n=1 Tax=Fusarium oxysporum f. sp. radicis-cucumerinum TaxID=327505 RepID=A0A2H3G4W1_FUSOX|nr:hypothetical protein FPRO04_13593 [Fusarium proliferatum]PCD25855.1 hypothetical protein AU210_012289 [Fusarium oxysporum f. sp. radicis-cucumerinum]RKK99715.1 hypothetical protein BFJ70_g17482 [Fusarium oxysporum]